jgi:hypothetical protein
MQKVKSAHQIPRKTARGHLFQIETGLARVPTGLFKAIDDKISAYTPLAEDDVDDGFLRYNRSVK